MGTRPLLLGQLLVRSGGIGEPQLKAALDEQKDSGRHLGDILVRRGYSRDDTVARALARQLKLPYAEAPLRPEADALEAARFKSRRHIEAVVATPSAVIEAVRAFYGGELAELLEGLPDLGGNDEDDRALRAAASAAPVVRLVDYILQEGAAAGTSDIHLEPFRGRLLVRYRIDGIPRRALTLPRTGLASVASRIKVMSGMDISVKRRPQDGGMALEHPGGSLRVRVVHAAGPGWREGRHAAPRPPASASRSGRAGALGAGSQARQAPHRGGPGCGPGRGAYGKRKEHQFVRRAGRVEPGGTQHRDARGSGGVRNRRHQPGSGQSAGRPDVSGRPAVDPTTRSRHRDGG